MAPAGEKKKKKGDGKSSQFRGKGRQDAAFYDFKVQGKGFARYD